jgi:ankyrin repeat protein
MSSLSVKFHGQADGWRQLQKAVQDDNGELVTALIIAGADPNFRDERQQTLLHIAARTAKAAAVKALLAGGADVHATDKEEHSVLRHALLAGQEAHKEKDEAKGTQVLACVKALLAAGADPYNFSYSSDDGRPTSDTMFSLACDFDIARAMRKVSDRFMINNVVNSPHYEAAKDLDFWLKDGKVPADTIDRYGKTAMIHACELGYADCAKILLEYKADPNFPGRDGRLPIHALATGKNPAMVQQLVDAGAHLTAKDAKGQTALDLARQAGNAPMVAALETAFNAFTEAATAAPDGLRAMKTLKFRPQGQT